jgi:hypothetical protein
VNRPFTWFTQSEFSAASQKVELYVLWGARCREARERDQAPLALRAAHPHTVGYVEGGDQEEGEIKLQILLIFADQLATACVKVQLGAIQFGQLRSAYWPASTCYEQKVVRNH